MQAVLLVGGLGTRLRATIPDIPKPLAPVGGIPFLSYLLDYLRRSGISKVLMLAGSNARGIKAFLDDAYGKDMEIAFSEENSLMGTGGALLNAFKLLEDEFLLLNGDTFFDVDLALLKKYFKDKKCQAAVALRFSEEIGRYGFVEVGRDGRVLEFHEKGDLPNERVDGFINGGIYAINKESLFQERSFWKGYPVSLERDIFPRWVLNGQLQGVPMGGRFIDIGVPEDYERAQDLVPLWSSQKKQRCLFLDRDGVLAKDTEYVHGENLTFFPDTLEKVREANQAGTLVVVVTNQSGVARGFYTEEDVHVTHRAIERYYAKNGARIDTFIFCPFHPGGTVKKYVKVSLARKPFPGMILKACEKHAIEIRESLMVGNKETDRVELYGLRFELYEHRKPSREALN